jgi:hypothetical protein
MILEEEVEKIRAVRHRISEDCGHDPKRLLEYYRRVSQELRASGQFRFAETAPKHVLPALREEPPHSGS